MTVYYVSPTGSDTQAGTVGQPFGSLQHAYDTARAGDEIQLRGGTYHLTQGIQLSNSGTSTQPITVRNYPGEVPVLDGSGITATGNAGYVLDMAGAAYNHISGLQVTGGAEGGVMIRNNAHDNVIEGLDVSHNGRLSEWEGKGFSLYDTSYNNLLLNNDSHDNRDLHGDNADGFQISSTGAGNVLRGNRAYNNSDDGFDLFNVQNGTSSGSVTLDGNWAWGNGMIDGQPTGGDGNGFKLGGQRPGTGTASGGHLLTNNVAWDNVASGFDENQATIPLTLRNNTAYDNGSYNFGLYSLQNTLSGNLSLGSGEIASSGTNSGNSWNLANAPGTSAVQSLDPSVAEGARAADGSLPASGFLSLSGSGATLGAASATGTAPASTAGTTTATGQTAGGTVTADPTLVSGTGTTGQSSTGQTAGGTATADPTLVSGTGTTGQSATGQSGTGQSGTGQGSSGQGSSGQTGASAVDPVTLVTGDPSGYAGSSASTSLVHGHHGGRWGHGSWSGLDTGSSSAAMTHPGTTTSTDPLHHLLGDGTSGAHLSACSKVG